MDNNRLVQIYLAELADRALRFHLHLDVVEREFYQVSPGLTDQTIPVDKPVFLGSFRHCIWKVLESISQLVNMDKGALTDDERQSTMEFARHAFLCINRLHSEGLVHLPRPSEPVELMRFCRIISEHVLNKRTSELAVYITETTSEGAFAADPLSEIKDKHFSQLIEIFNGLRGITPIEAPMREGTNIIHVTIARIDSRNPIRWPSLFHEAAHKLLTTEVTNHQSLEELFNEWLGPEALNVVMQLNVNILQWLTEIWCDLFAALVMGPCFFFSQFVAFVTNPPTDSSLSSDYPPHSFRLRLIEMFLQHRYSITELGDVYELMDESVEVVEYWDNYYAVDLRSNKYLKAAFDGMHGFFQEHFFSGKGTEADNFQSKFDNMVRYVRAIDEAGLKRMQRDLAKGLPIASKRRESRIIDEEPTSVQEVLLVACLDRLSRLRQSTVQAIRTHKGNQWDQILKKEVLPDIERFDYAVLRSLQLGEWLHILSAQKPLLKGCEDTTSAINEPRVNVENLQAARSALFIDREIYALLEAESVRVIPLVNIDDQLGSTSLDIRLGTSFEVFLPVCRRPSHSPTTLAESYDSRRIDLDYLEHVVLLPGQFMLAHSFEYLKLPNWIAADLDGRSSYARLGLEVHMTAGMIDPGFEGVVTFELYNGGANPIRLFPGLRIAQIRFTCVGEPYRPYSKQHTAKYRGMLQYNTSLYMNDPDFQTMQSEIDTRGQHL